MSVKLDYESLGRDGLSEIADKALAEIVANIQDPNTDFKKARKLVIEVAFKPNEQRNFPEMTYAVKMTLAPVKPVSVTSMVEADGNGELALFIPEIGTRPDQYELPIEKPKNVTPMKEAVRG